MVRRLKENNDYLNVSKNYDRLVLNAIELAKQTGCEQIIYLDKDGFYGSVKAKSGKPITPLRDDDEIIGKIRVINKDGKRDAVYITDYPAVQESKKRTAKGPMSRYIREDIDLDVQRDECQMKILEISNMLDDLKEELADVEYLIDNARRINDHYFDHGYEGCKNSIESVSVFISWFRSATM